jgi:photosystem II stability/assembly factor-like uncharacterized protein
MRARDAFRHRFLAGALALSALAAPAGAGENLWTGIGPIGGGGWIRAVAVDPKNPATVYVAYGYQGLWKTTDAGATWSLVGVGLTNWDFRAVAIAPSDPSTLYAATVGGVYGSTDAGATWHQTGSVGSIGPPFRGIAIDPLTPTTAYVAGGSCIYTSCFGGIAKTTDGGVTWLSSGPLNSAVSGLVILPGPPYTLFAIAGSSLQQSADGGSSWTAASLPAYASALTVAVGPPQTLYAAAYPGEVYRSIDAGATWQQARAAGLLGQYVVRLVADAVTPSTVYAASADPDRGIYRSTDSGDTWTFVRSASNVTTLAAPASAHGAIWAATDGFGLLRSDATGATWSRVTNVFPNLDVRKIVTDPSSPAKIYALTASGLYKTLDAGDSWILLPLDADVSTIAIDPGQSDIVYAALSATAGGVLKSTDGGTTWRSASAGLPAKDAATDAVTGLGVNPASPSTLFAGTYSSGTFKTTDAGATWSPVPGLASIPNITSFAFDPQHPSILYACSTYHGVWKSIDAGASWRSLGPPFYVLSIVIDPSNPTTLWATATFYTGSSLLWKSVDGGESWLLASSGLPSLNPRILALDPISTSTAYLGTDAGAFRTDDGGATWSDLSAGLTNTNLAALALAPGNPTVVYAGTRGNSVFQLTVQRAETSCSPGATTFCLGGGRFRVETSFRASQVSLTSSAHTLSVSSETGGFWFFDPDNLELVVKVLDGRSVNGKFWVFYGALTNVEYTITVTDTETGATRTYFNPQGQIASVADTSAF